MSGRHPILPLRQTLSILPLGELGLPMDASILDRIGIENYNIDVDEEKNIVVITSQIALINEVVLGLPGTESLGLVIGADEGISSFPLVLKFGNEFLISLTELRSLLRIPPSVLIKAKHPEGSTDVPEGSTDVNAWIKDESAPYEIVLPSLSFSLDHDLNFEVEGTPSLSLAPAFIGDTGLVFEANGIQLYFNANAAPPLGRPIGFKGLYIESARLYLPPDFVLGDVIFSISQAGVGNGGVFGRVAASWDNQLSETAPFVSGDAIGTFLGVPFALKEIALTLNQNIPTEANLRSEFLLPFFDKAVGLDISIEVDGNFAFVLRAAENAENDDLIKLDLPEILEFTVESFTGKKEGSLGIFSIKGQMKPLLADLDWPSFDIDELSIDTDGNIDFDGGWVDIPETFTLNFYAFKLGISQFGFGTEGEDSTSQRQWLGLSGELNLVEGLDLKASVEGLNFSWPKGGGDVTTTLKGIAVEFEIPNTLSLKGSVKFEELTEDNDGGTGLRGNLFRGNINLKLMTVRLEIEAELIIGKLTDADGNQFTTFFIVLGAQLPAGIPLGATGTSLYGVKGLGAMNAGPTKTEEQNWYEWYMAEPERSITSIEKYKPISGYNAFGAGVTLGTMFDDGFTLNMSVMLAVLLPGPVVILEGKANLLKQRMEGQQESGGPEGAFYLLAVLDGRAGTFMLNVDVKYSLKDIITVGASLEAFFDFNDSSNWYVYIGRKPEEKRIRAEILSLFGANAYFMIDNTSFQTGASVGFDFRKKYGPVQVFLVAKIGFDAAIFWQPMQLQGALELEAALGIKVFGIGLELYMYMLMEGRVPEPYWIHGIAEVGVKLFWPLPDIKLHVELEWSQDADTQPVWPLLKECSFAHHKGSASTWTIPIVRSDDSQPDWSKFPIVPVDSRPVLTFARPMYNLARESSLGSIPLFSGKVDDVGGTTFKYKLDSEELILQEYVFGDGDWSDVKKSINTDEGYSGRDADEEGLINDKFIIDTNSIINRQDNIDPNEPKIQLWKYSARDHNNEYTREDDNINHPVCTPRLYPKLFTVEWLGVPNNTQYEYAFSYGNLFFVVDQSARDSRPKVINKLLHCGSITINFPEPIYQVGIEMNGFKSGEAFYNGASVGSLTRHTNNFFYRGVKPINSIRLASSTQVIVTGAGRIKGIIQKITYMTKKGVIDQLSGTDPSPSATNENLNGELVLKPATFYRLKVKTSLDVDDNVDHESTVDYMYFRTDEGPGITSLSQVTNSTAIEEEKLTHKDKPVNRKRSTIVPLVSGLV